MTMRAVRTFSVVTAAATFLLLLIGGLVNPTGSSLACPDWPLCYGSVMPPMVGGILYEHSHRLAATAVGIMTLFLAALLWRAGRPRLGLLALAMVVVQGVLGGVTVLLRLPALVSIAHLALSMAFFAYLLWLPVRATPAGAADVAPGVRRWIVAASALVYAQIILGAIVRHTGSWLACGVEVPLCQGRIWPLGGGGMAQVHMAHRLLGVLVALVVTIAAVRALRGLAGWPRRLAVAAPFLVAAQLALGAFAVLTVRSVAVVELHLAVAILLLADTWLLTLLTRAAIPRPVPAGKAVAATKRSSPSGTIGAIRAYVELTKPRISVLNCLTAAVGMALAPGPKPAPLWFFGLAGMLLLVTSASTLNMVLEREADARMARTRRRPLPTGRVSPAGATIFGLLQGVVALLLLTFGTTALTGLLGAVALALYVLVYTPLKPVTYLALLVGAVPGAAPPLLGWTAVTGEIQAVALVLFGIIFFWQVPHFLAITLFHEEDYRAAGFRTFPLARGEAATRQAIVGSLVLQIAVTLALVPLGVGGAAYGWGALVLGAVMLGWGLYGLRGRSDHRWARRLFLLSIAYLPVLFALMVIH